MLGNLRMIDIKIFGISTQPIFPKLASSANQILLYIPFIWSIDHNLKAVFISKTYLAGSTINALPHRDLRPSLMSSSTSVTTMRPKLLWIKIGMLIRRCPGTTLVYLVRKNYFLHNTFTRLNSKCSTTSAFPAFVDVFSRVRVHQCHRHDET